MTRTVRQLAAIALPAMCLIGCAQWKETASFDPVDSATTASVQNQPNRVVLEVRFANANLDALEPDQLTGLWQWVDETAIDAEVRQRLLDNGVRVGMLTNRDRFEKQLHACTNEPDVVESFLNEASVASEISHGDQQIPMRLGRRCELALRQPFEGSHVTLIRTDSDVIGRTLNHAQYFLALTASPTDNVGQVRLRIQPEIHHGAARQKWVSSDTAIRIDTRREIWSLDMLEMDVTAAAGDTIVLVPDTPMHGLATKMLTGNGADQHEQQLIVMLHLAQIPSPTDPLAVARR